MNVDKGEKILRLLDSLDAVERLSTASLVLIHLCMHHGYSKPDSVENFANQWDLYQQQIAKHGDKGKLH